MIEIEGGTSYLRVCVTHAPYLLAAQRAHLRGVPRRCLACGAVRAETFNANLWDCEASLWGPQLTALLDYHLDSKAFKRLTKDAGDPERVFHHHGDFYTKRGIAIQPNEKPALAGGLVGDQCTAVPPTSAGIESCCSEISA